MEILENFGAMDLDGCPGAEPLEASEKLKKLSRKINGKLQNIETFHQFLQNFDLKKLILIEIKASLMEF